MPRHGRRQTYFETPGPHRDATPCLFPRTRPMPASERGSRRKRTWGLMQSYLGAETNASGSRDERAWEQTRTHLLPDSLTNIGSRGKDIGALEADCNAERMASALGGRALKIQRKSSLAVAPSQRKFALRQHNQLLRRQHCSSLCSQSEGHEHVANMTNALGHDFVGFSVLVRHNIRPPSLCEQSELQCFAPGLRQMFARCPFQRCCTRLLFAQKRAEIFLDFNTLPERAFSPRRAADRAFYAQSLPT